MVTQSYTISTVRTATPPRVKMSQYDHGSRTIVFTVVDSTGTEVTLTGYTVTVEGTRIDGHAFAVACTVSGATATFTETADMTNTAGDQPAELVITDGTDRLATMKFVISVEPTAMDEDASITEEDESLFEQLYGSVTVAETSAITAIEDAQETAVSAVSSAQTTAVDAVGDAKDDALMQIQTGLASGAPAVVATVAEMTDTSLCYVYSGAETGYTAGNWYYYDGSNWVSGGVYGAGTIDTALSTSSTNAVQNKVVTEAVSDLQSDLTSLTEATEIEIQDDIQWGHYNPYSDGTVWDRTNSARLTSMDFVPLSDISISGAMSFVWMGYSDATDFAFVTNQSSTWIKAITVREIRAISDSIRYLRIILKRDDDSDTEFTDINTYGVNISTAQSNVICRRYMQKYYDDYPLDFEQGGFTSAGINSGAPRDMRTPIYLPVSSGDIVKVKVYTSVDITIALNYYNTDDFATTRVGVTKFFENNAAFQIPDDTTYIRVIIRKTSGNFAAGQVTGGKMEIINADESTSYMVDNLFMHHDISVIDNENQLEYVQSFCVYNNKYYSTDGSHLARQSSDFTLETSVDISIGHSNGLQLGSNGIAYASGWDDNTVYKVDLASMSVIGTIALPTTGYTTCVVDDVANIAYIFQRETYPDTIVPYNFIVYDITNEEIISTRKTVPFSAQQACDIVNDTIVCSAGLATNENPNRFLLFNTNGDLIGQMYIPILNNIEPEGVYIDREDNRKILLSDVGAYVYEVRL